MVTFVLSVTAPSHTLRSKPVPQREFQYEPVPVWMSPLRYRLYFLMDGNKLLLA